MLLGLLQFVSTFAIAWLYSRRFAKQFDPRSAKIRSEFKEFTDRS